MHLLHSYVRYDYVQRFEDTVSVELRYITMTVLLLLLLLLSSSSLLLLQEGRLKLGAEIQTVVHCKAAQRNVR